MKRAGIAGLAVIAAMALIAVVGAGSALASETTICKNSTNEPYCATGDRYPSGTPFEANSSSVKFSGSEGGFIECSESSLKGETNAAAGEPLPLSLGMTLEGCTDTYGKACTVIEGEEDAQYSGALSLTSSSNGTLDLSWPGYPEEGPWWFFECKSGAGSCFGELASPLTFTGGQDPKIVANNVQVNRGFTSPYYCPQGKVTFNATYTVDSPDPAFLAVPVMAESHTRLCKASESPCQIGNTYPFGTMIEAEAPTVKVQTNGFTITCGKSTLSAKTQAVGAEPLPLGNVTFFLSECTSAQIGNCSVQTSALPIQSWITAGEGYPYLALYSSWSFDCTALDCVVDTEGTVGGLSHSKEKAIITYNEAELNEKGGLCGNRIRLNAAFTVTTPGSLFAT